MRLLNFQTRLTKNLLKLFGLEQPALRVKKKRQRLATQDLEPVKRSGDDGPWLDDGPTLDGHSWWPCGRESRARVCA